MDPSDLIVYPSRATAADAIAGLGDHVDIVEDRDVEFLRALEDACTEAGIDFAFAASHCANETNLFRDDLFRTRRNPAGIGVTGQSGVFGPTFPSYRVAARFYIAELLLKLRRSLGSFAEARQYAPAKFDAVAELVAGSEGPFPTIARIRDLNTRFGPLGADGRPRECAWMCDPDGPEAICSKAKLLFPRLPAQTQHPPKPSQGGTVTYTTVVPGLPGGPLVTTYPIRQLIVRQGQVKQRPGRKARLPRREVQHGNGNPRSTAAGEARYVYDGAGGRVASYHSAADDVEVWVMVPADEVTYQAADGGGPGNESGFSCEMVEDRDIWADPARRAKVIHNTADFMGRVAARLNIPLPEQHWDFNYVVCGCPSPCDRTCDDRHNCPDKLRHVRMPDGRMAWEHYLQQWRVSRADEFKRMQGGEVTPPPAKPKYPVTRKKVTRPGTITFAGLPSVTVARAAETRWRCTHGTSLRTYPSRDAPAAVKTPATRRSVKTFPWLTTIDGEEWLVSTAGSYALRKAFEPA